MGRVAVAFLLGHCVIHCLARLPSWHWSVGLLVAAVVLGCVGRFKLVATFLAGLGWALLNCAWRSAGDLPPALEGRDVLVRGHVASVPNEAGADSQFLLDVAEPRGGVAPRIRLTWYRVASAPQAGELWQLVVRLKRRNGFANPGGADHEAQLYREGIGATGYVRDDARNRRLAPPSLSYGVTRMRAWISRRMHDAVPDGRMLGVLQGLAVGDTQAMSPQQWRVFAATGTTHLMAISGLHISMVAALAAWLGGAIVRWPAAQARRWSAMQGQVVAGASAALVYSALAGMSVPTQRTLLMLTIYFASRWRRRTLGVTHTLGLSLIGVLLIDPFAPLAPGAWLSFGAVAIILLAVAGRVGREGAIATFVRVQAAVTVGLVPLLLAAFGGVSLLSPVANAIAIPLFTLVVVPMVLLGACVASVSVAAAEWVLAVPVALLHWTWPVLQWLAERPLALWYFPEPSLPAFCALVAGATMLVMPGIWPTRLAGVLLCLPVLLHRIPGPGVGNFELAVLDVGQGLAVVVRTHEHALLYDAGPSWGNDSDSGSRIVVPFLRGEGVGRLDAVVISHADDDHYGGADSVARSRGPPWLLSPLRADDPLHERFERSARCEAGFRWRWDGVEFSVLHPAAAIYSEASGRKPRKENDRGCVVRVATSRASALLTGDVEARSEQEMLSRDPDALRSDLMLVPHHGSKTSSTAAFLDAVGPRAGLVSLGYRNRFRHPHETVVARYAGRGIALRRTDREGALHVVLPAESGDAIRIEGYAARSRYWSERRDR